MSTQISARAPPPLPRLFGAVEQKSNIRSLIEVTPYSQPSGTNQPNGATFAKENKIRTTKKTCEHLYTRSCDTPDRPDGEPTAEGLGDARTLTFDANQP